MKTETASREIESLDYYLQNHTNDYSEESHTAMMMARDALEREPCEDAISRQAVKRALEDRFMELQKRHDDKRYETNYCLNTILELPPVTPQPKTGHWIMPVQDDGMSEPICYQVRCSECGFDLDPQTWHMELHQYSADKYCPNCGARMDEPQESEVQE